MIKDERERRNEDERDKTYANHDGVDISVEDEQRKKNNDFFLKESGTWRSIMKRPFVG